MAALRRPRGRVVIVDDDPTICELVWTALTEHGYTTRRASDGREFLYLIEREVPEVVLLDVHLPDVSGYQVCRKLREEFGDAIGIVFVSGERTESFDRVAGLLLGANDYLTKPFVLDELIARVDRVEASSRPVPSAPAVERKLTRRELEVLRLLASGMGPEDVARLLVISRKTIDKHIEHILLKLGVHTRAQAVAVAFRDDLAALGIDSGDLDGAFSPNVTSIDAARRSSTLVG